MRRMSNDAQAEKGRLYRISTFREQCLSKALSANANVLDDHLALGGIVSDK